MKNFSKLVFTVLFVLAVAPAFSQFSAGLDLAIPNGSWSDFWGTGFGASVRYEAPIQEKLNWTASAGFISFSGKSYNFGGFGSITAPSETIIPVTGGVKYYFQKSNGGFYGAADLGFFIANNSAGTKFGFSPGVGYRLEKFDFAFRFNAVSDLNYLGLRAAYIFPGK
ncbi:MAG: hypothetical protein HY015_10185 [Bacteroidetes bacterium]|nr:hypothetical protein [Bacteroidota bacterium]MBI3483319.1 hypothetical protein [Bacteroidota bacterium]